MSIQASQCREPCPPIFVVSGGVGASGEQVVNTVLAQFPGCKVPVVTVKNVRSIPQIEAVIAQAKNQNGTIVHTMVDACLRCALCDITAQENVPAVDLMGPLLTRLEISLGQPPLGQPGLYRQLHRTYFERVSAIEYTLAHDDGQRPDGWAEADVVLVGVSRTGKTPLCIYLSVLGWKAANLPIVPDLPTPQQLFQLDPLRVIGLTIDLDRLLSFRRQRSSHVGIGGRAGYADPMLVEDELRVASRVFREGGFYVVDVTDKTIEASADEVIRRILPRTRPG